MRYRVWILLTLMPLAVAACDASNRKVRTESKAVAAQPAVKDFELVASSGQSFVSQQLSGKVWIASYFFTQCGANCRNLNMTLSRLSRDYGPQGVHFVSITCDPENDTPEVLSEYARIFNADPQYWTFVTGDLGYVQRIGSDMFEVSVTRRAHVARITIMDQDGQARGTFDVLDPLELERAKKLVDRLLAANKT